MKRIVTLQDISCLGRCSVTVALPVISAMGVECVALPTAVLSTHTTFPDFTCLDLTDQIAPIARHWKAQSIHFDAIYTGYLASPDQCDRVIEFFQDFRTPDGLIFVDPAMADGGKLYAALGPDFPQAMARVCAQADILVPNLTEACLLTGTPYDPAPCPQYMEDLLKKLLDLGCRQVLLTGAEVRPGEVGVLGLDQTGRSFSYGLPRLPQSYHGTGDLFASACVGGLMNGLTLEQAARIAARFVSASISATAVNPDASWYGVEFEGQIPTLLSLLDQARQLAGPV